MQLLKVPRQFPLNSRIVGKSIPSAHYVVVPNPNRKSTYTKPETQSGFRDRERKNRKKSVPSAASIASDISTLSLTEETGATSIENDACDLVSRMPSKSVIAQSIRMSFLAGRGGGFGFSRNLCRRRQALPNDGRADAERKIHPGPQKIL